jgi:hypothetical protein
MAEAAFNLADGISLADVGENVRRRNGYHDGLARSDVLAALEAGCGLMLRWVGDDGREVCREFPKRDSYEDILVWAGLPRRLCVELPPTERKGSLPYPYAYLLRADAVRLGLWPASESPQAKQQSEPQQPPSATQPKRKPKRKPRRKAGPGRERIYNHEAITGAGNSVLARGRPDTKALFFEKVIAECRAAKPKIKLPPNIDVDDSLLRRVVGKLYDGVLYDDVKDERHN